MRGGHPKPKDMRARRNKTPDPVVLGEEVEPREESPELGPHPQANGEEPQDWHPLVVEWWKDTWSSPQASLYLTVDRHGLYRCALLMDQFWKTGDPVISAQLRLSLEKYGQSPLDRLRLRWENARTDEAERKRKPQAPEPKDGAPKEDPRLKLA